MKTYQAGSREVIQEMLKTDIDKYDANELLSMFYDKIVQLKNASNQDINELTNIGLAIQAAGGTSEDYFIPESTYPGIKKIIEKIESAQQVEGDQKRQAAQATLKVKPEGEQSLEDVE
jgi:hypothetical protein